MATKTPSNLFNASCLSVLVALFFQSLGRKFPDETFLLVGFLGETEDGGVRLACQADDIDFRIGKRPAIDALLDCLSLRVEKILGHPVRWAEQGFVAFNHSIHFTPIEPGEYLVYLVIPETDLQVHQGFINQEVFDVSDQVSVFREVPCVLKGIDVISLVIRHAELIAGKGQGIMEPLERQGMHWQAEARQ
jgi:hypothetical protein